MKQSSLGLSNTKGRQLRAGTVVDATLIAAPTSTKNEGKARDPEMHQSKKGNEWHFGMKARIVRLFGGAPLDDLLRSVLRDKEPLNSYELDKVIGLLASPRASVRYAGQKADVDPRL